MRLNRWVCAAGSLGLVWGALAEQACSGNANYCTGSGATETCFIYTPEPIDSGVVRDTGVDVAKVDGGIDVFVPWSPGTGSACPGPTGKAPVVSCDPSDEMAPGCSGGVDAGCTFSPKCGDLKTCEPFTTNPIPGTGVDSFRMRLINITAPPNLAMPLVQSAVVSMGVDLPALPEAGGAPCGEDGTGLFNWLMQVDKEAGTMLTGGAPPSADPFDTGYCFLRANILGQPIAPVTVPVEFTPGSNTFSTKVLTGTASIPIFVTASNLSSVVILPISGISLSDVTMSDDGNCIGAVNNNASMPGSNGQCADPAAFGPTSCARWHSAGALSGYITLAAADDISIALLGESLCVLLTGDKGANDRCTEAGLHMGDYCAGPDGGLGKACSSGDSMWLSAQFAASAVKVTPQGVDSGVPLCNNGKIVGDGG